MEHTVEADQAASAEGDEQWGEGTEDMATEEETWQRSLRLSIQACRVQRQACMQAERRLCNKEAQKGPYPLLPRELWRPHPSVEDALTSRVAAIEPYLCLSVAPSYSIAGAIPKEVKRQGKAAVAKYMEQRRE